EWRLHNQQFLLRLNPFSSGPTVMTGRNRHLRSRGPFRAEQITLESAEGPFGFLTPTRAHSFYRLLSATSCNITPHKDAVTDHALEGRLESNQPTENVRFLWRPRDNRKGRHALLVQRPAPGENARFLTPRRTSHPREVLKNIVRTFTYFPIWDISWLVG